MNFLKFLGIIFCSWIILAMALICPFMRNAMPEPVKDAAVTVVATPVAISLAVVLKVIGFSEGPASSDSELVL